MDNTTTKSPHETTKQIVEPTWDKPEQTPGIGHNNGPDLTDEREKAPETAQDKTPDKSRAGNLSERQTARQAAKTMIGKTALRAVPVVGQAMTAYDVVTMGLDAYETWRGEDQTPAEETAPASKEPDPEAQQEEDPKREERQPYYKIKEAERDQLIKGQSSHMVYELDKVRGNDHAKEVTEVLSKRGDDVEHRQQWQQRFAAAKEVAREVENNQYQAATAAEQLQYGLAEKSAALGGDDALDRVYDPHQALETGRELANDLTIRGYADEEIRAAFHEVDPQITGMGFRSGPSSHGQEDVTLRYFGSVMRDVRSPEVDQEKTRVMEWRFEHEIAPDDRRLPEEHILIGARDIEAKFSQSPEMQPETAQAEYMRQLGVAANTHGKDILKSDFRDEHDYPLSQGIGLRMYGTGWSKAEIENSVVKYDPTITRLSGSEKQAFVDEQITPLLDSRLADEYRQAFDNWRDRFQIPETTRRFDSFNKSQVQPEADLTEEESASDNSPSLDDDLYDDF